MSPVLETERHARRLRVWFALISILGGMSELLVFRRVEAVTSWQWLQFLAVAVAFLAMAVAVRRPSRLQTVAAYFVVFGSCMLALWVTNGQLAASGAEFQTFAGFKLALIGGALILPGDPLIALPALLASALLPVLEWASWPVAWRAHVATGEPLGTLAYGLIALALFAHRIRSAAMQRRIVESEAEAAAMKRVARVALAVRDLANTPAQTLALGLDQLKQGRISPQQVDRMLRALGQLHELNKMLEPYSETIRWEQDDASLDARAVIEAAGRLASHGG